MRTFLVVAVFVCSSSVCLAQPNDADAIRPAVVKSLALLEKTAAEYTKHRKCFSCHHQGLGSLAVGLPRERGFHVDEAAWPRTGSRR